jgi:hypothetical protein
MNELATTAEIAETTQAAVEAGPATIVHIRKIGPKGGKGERLRLTPPDQPPAAGSLVVFRGDTYRVLDVYEEGWE